MQNFPQLPPIHFPACEPLPSLLLPRLSDFLRLTIVFGTWGLVMDMGNVMGGDAVTSHSTGDDNSHVVQPRPTERERNGSRQVYSMPKIKSKSDRESSLGS